MILINLNLGMYWGMGDGGFEKQQTGLDASLHTF